VNHMSQLYRQSLFFVEQERADKAEALVESLIEEELAEDTLLQSLQSIDDDTGIVEVRFYTEQKLDDWTQLLVIQYTEPDTYDLNCEDW
jgi:hypothetical protein